MSLQVLSISSHYFLPIFLAAFKLYVVKTTRLMRLSKNRSSAAQPGYIPSYNRNDQYMVKGGGWDRSYI